MRRKDCRACFEQGRVHDRWKTSECQAYDAQVAFGKRVRRLLAADGAIPVPPAPDYSTPEAVTARAREAGTLGQWDREVYAALESDGRLFRQFRRAVEKSGAQMPLLPRIAPPSPTRRRRRAA